MKPKSEIKMRNGAPALFVNGRPRVPLAFWRGEDHDLKYLADFAKLGVNIVFFTTTTRFWRGPGEYDFTELDKVLENTIKASPEALIIPRIYLMPPKWWVETNRSELRMTEDGGLYHGAPDEYLNGQILPSIASPKWRSDTAGFLDAFVARVESGPYAKHVIGYHLSSEQSEEWFYWGGPSVDYNPSNQTSFRQWLRTKYRDPELFKKLWHNSEASFEYAKLPSVQSRKNPDCGEFFSPETQQNVIDFYEYHHWKIVDTIRYFAAAVKKKSGRRALVSVFYGYQLQPIPRGQLDSGHYALRELLGSKDIDMLSSPTSYSGRELGTGYSHIMSLAGSVKLHNKLWFDENDIRTHVNVPGNDGYGKTKTLEETISMQWREFGNEACNSIAGWWMDQSGGWYNDPELLKEIGKIYETGKLMLSSDLSSAAEAAVIIDERSQYLKGPNDKFQTFQGIVEIGHLGAPVDFILLEDLPLARPYKLYYFKYFYRSSVKIEDMINKAVKNSGKWAVWLDKPGFFNEDIRTVCATNADPITGIHMSEDLAVYHEDADISARTGRPSKDFGEWKSVYLRDYPTPEEFRKIAKEAGVHIYLDTGDVIYANRSFLCVHANAGGEKKIRLPRASTVFDLVNRKEVGSGISEFTVFMKPLSTLMYHLK